MRPYTRVPNPTGKDPDWVIPQALSSALKGKTNNIVDAVLTQSSTTSVLTSPLFTPQSGIIAIPLTANAALALVGSYWSSRADGTAIWAAMLSRCKNPRNKRYSRYGGRGILVCDRWIKFENFVADMGERPAEKTIDRINNDGNYEPGNCRWSTVKEQQNNRSTNVLLAMNGKTLNLTQWCAEIGINYSTIMRRIRRGLPVEKILFKGRIHEKSPP